MDRSRVVAATRRDLLGSPFDTEATRIADTSRGARYRLSLSPIRVSSFESSRSAAGEISS